MSPPPTWIKVWQCQHPAIRNQTRVRFCTGIVFFRGGPYRVFFVIVCAMLFLVLIIFFPLNVQCRQFRVLIVFFSRATKSRLVQSPITPCGFCLERFQRFYLLYNLDLSYFCTKALIFSPDFACACSVPVPLCFLYAPVCPPMHGCIPPLPHPPPLVFGNTRIRSNSDVTRTLVGVFFCDSEATKLQTRALKWPIGHISPISVFFGIFLGDRRFAAFSS